MKKARNKKLSLDKLNITKLTKLNFVVGGYVESQVIGVNGCEPDLTVRPRNTGTTAECPTNGQCENEFA